MATTKHKLTTEEAREYWSKTDVESSPRRGRRPGWKVSTLYLGELEDRALSAFAKLAGEPMAAVIRRAVRDLVMREAKKYGTTWKALSGQE